MIEILKAPPFATIQDLGWATGRRFGLPRSGAMDPPALRQVNAALGNPEGHAAIEWALGPGAVRFRTAGLLCVTRGGALTVDDAPVAGPLARVPAGGVIGITPAGPERFVYVGVRGGIDVPLRMGCRSTYLPGGFGGHEGRRLKAGDALPVGPEPAGVPPGWASDPPDPPPGAAVVLRVMPGPQWDRFDDEARARFLESRFMVLPASDRMGYRLGGATIRPRDAALLPSEPACPGAVQVPDGGEPIVLMPDGPTVGGYPKIAVLVEADLSRLAQCHPGRAVRFTPA